MLIHLNIIYELPSGSLVLLLELFILLCLFLTLGVSDDFAPAASPFKAPGPERVMVGSSDPAPPPIRMRDTGSFKTSYAVNMTLSVLFSLPKAKKKIDFRTNVNRLKGLMMTHQGSGDR